MTSDHSLADELLNALEQTTAAMNRHGVSCALIGGLAASYRSQPRFTKDVDLLVQWKSLVRIQSPQLITANLSRSSGSRPQ
jgi:hypothetical protein